MTDIEYIKQLRIPTLENPLRVLTSACLLGTKCGYDATANGEYPSVLKLNHFDNVELFRFCPEDFSFGTPREMCDIHGGTGEDVLNGKARVLSETGKDWTNGMIEASHKMLEVAVENKVELAILMDVSAACGSQVIYNGNRFSVNKVYQIGAGVCTAQLIRNNIKVISQRDYASLEILYSKLDIDHAIDTTKLDHHQIEWYKTYFNKS